MPAVCYNRKNGGPAIAGGLQMYDQEEARWISKKP